MSILRKSVIAALSLTVLAGTVLLVKGDAYAAPRQPAPGSGSEEAVRERIELYTQLRCAEDWEAVYDMVDPVQRESVDKGRFLTLYGQGVLKTSSIDVLGLDIDYDELVAVARVETKAELVVSKLPRNVRSTLVAPSSEDLVNSMEHDLLWAWRDGEWYVRLDEAVEQGETSEGRAITPLTPTASGR